MGSMLISQCKCGLESDELYVGGGMMDFNETVLGGSIEMLIHHFSL